ncbi:MAG: DUF7948 domain-containing protein, partial [Candidatus Latescibacterota bacterium]
MIRYSIVHALTGALLILCASGAFAAPAAESIRLDPEFGKVPLSFVLNEGQFDPMMKFVAEGNADSVYERNPQDPPVTRFMVERSSSPAQKPAHESALTIFNSLELYFVQPNLNPVVTGEDPYSWKSNYFFGNDPAKWKTDLLNYRRVLVHDFYPGIDLRYNAKERDVSFELIVRGGTDPSVMTFRHTYTPESLQITANGSINIWHGFSYEMTIPAPSAYQVIDGKEIPVPLKYKELNAQTRLIGFEYGVYDPKYDLIIHPEEVFTPYIGSRAIRDYNGSDMDVDNQGNVYVMGQGVYISYYKHFGGFFIYKLSSDGRELGYVSYISGVDSGREIAVDASGNVYMTGRTSLDNYKDFPFTAGAFETMVQGYKCFVLKLNAKGNRLEYSTLLGKDNNYQSYAIAVDARGCAYITGETRSGTATTPGAYDVTLNGRNDVFITKLSPDGKSLEYSTLVGGDGNDYGCGIVVDALECAYIGGYTGSTDFPTTKGAFDETRNFDSDGVFDAFVLKLNKEGSGLIYSTLIGGSKKDYVYALALDAEGNAYITGETESTDFPVTQGAYDQTYNGGSSDIFVAKLNENGSQLIFSTYLGDTDTDLPTGILTDPYHNIFLATYNLGTVGIDKDGKKLLYLHPFSSSASAIAVRNITDIYVLGSDLYPIIKNQLFDGGLSVQKYIRNDVTNGVHEFRKDE